MEHNRIRAGARRLLALSCAAAAVLLFGSGAAGQTQTPALSYGEPGRLRRGGGAAGSVRRAGAAG